MFNKLIPMVSFVSICLVPNFVRPMIAELAAPVAQVATFTSQREVLKKLLAECDKLIRENGETAALIKSRDNGIKILAEIEPFVQAEKLQAFMREQQRRNEAVLKSRTLVSIQYAFSKRLQAVRADDGTIAARVKSCSAEAIQKGHEVLRENIDDCLANIEDDLERDVITHKDDSVVFEAVNFEISYRESELAVVEAFQQEWFDPMFQYPDGETPYSLILELEKVQIDHKAKWPIPFLQELFRAGLLGWHVVSQEALNKGLFEIGRNRSYQCMVGEILQWHSCKDTEGLKKLCIDLIRHDRFSRLHFGLLKKSQLDQDMLNMLLKEIIAKKPEKIDAIELVARFETCACLIDAGASLNMDIEGKHPVVALTELLLANGPDVDKNALAYFNGIMKWCYNSQPAEQALPQAQQQSPLHGQLVGNNERVNELNERGIVRSNGWIWKLWETFWGQST